MEILGDLKDWPSGQRQLPPNRPYCGFTGDDPMCSVIPDTVALPVALSLSIFAVLLLLAIAIGARRYVIKRDITVHKEN